MINLYHKIGLMPLSAIFKNKDCGNYQEMAIILVAERLLTGFIHKYVLNTRISKKILQYFSNVRHNLAVLQRL